MNSLSSRQRKIVFAVCIMLLLVPIVYLGAPTSEDVVPGSRETVSGGRLAQLRVQYDLGESNLGDVDPSSAAMNLVLLGLRGPAAGVLHLQAIEYQKRKDWSGLKNSVDSIIKLQPHYIEIWKFQGWNLAYNVSREWDRVDDRFYWVKEGMKFLQLGTTRNHTATILFHNVGDFIGRKFGNSDEKKFFRKFFVSDPDVEQFDGGADPVLNKDGKDNYLVAKDWFDVANDLDINYRVKGMTHVFFRQGPARALFDYAKAHQTDGPQDLNNDGAIDEDEKATFTAASRAAWNAAYREWTEVYGRDIFLGLNDVRYRLNSSPDDIEEMHKENEITPELQAKVWEQNVKMTNYRFWMQLADCERDDVTVAAHLALSDGKRAYAGSRVADGRTRDGELQPSEAQLAFDIALLRFEEMFEKYPNMTLHDDYIREVMTAVLYLKKVHQSNGRTMPEDYPLKDVFVRNAALEPDIEQEIRRENATRF